MTKTSSPRLICTRLTVAAAAAVLVPAAHGAVFSYITTLTGAAEAPPNASPGFGSSILDIDTVANTMRLRTTFGGLTGNVTVAHIHGATAVAGTGTAGVATPTPTFPAFPAGVTSGSYDRTFDMTLASSYNGAFVTANGGVAGARAALFQAVADGKTYLNIHSSTFGGGEIRGFYAVPGAGVLALAGPIGLVALRRRR